MFEVAAARKRAGVTILDVDGNRMYRTYEEMLADAAEKAGALTARDIGPGDRLALFARTSFDFIVGCMACWRLGAVVVPLASPPKFMSHDAWTKQAASRIRAAGVRAVLSSDDIEDHVGDVRVVPLAELKSSTSLTVPGPDVNSPAVIQFTSGSTANPRGIVLSHSTLVAQLDILLETFNEGRPDAHAVSWLPLYHDLGFVAMLLTHIAAGDPITLLSPELFLFDPAIWLVEISRNRAYLSGAPAFAYGVAARAIEKGLPEPIDLSCWETAASGGESINPKPVHRFFESAGRFGFDPGAFCAGYGLAEASCVATVARPGQGLQVDFVDRGSLVNGKAVSASTADAGGAQFVSCGPPLPRIEVEVVGENGKPVAEREIGEVRIAGPTLMQGYVDDPESTGAVLRGKWLTTGDVGYLAGGDLYITGRAKDTIIIRGQNFSPEDLERVVEEAPGTRWGASAAIGVRTDDSESAVFVVETKVKDRSELRGLRSEIQKRLLSESGIVARDLLFLPPYSLPRTSSGKLQRSKVRSMYESGELRGLALEAGDEDARV